MFEVPGTGTDIALAVEHQEVPAFLIFRCPMQPPGLEVFGLDRSVVNVDGSTETLHLLHQMAVAGWVHVDVPEIARHVLIRRRKKHQPTLDRRNTSLE
jgi:hypothetical protein